MPSASRSSNASSSVSRGGRDRDVEAADLVDRVVVDLREDQLLPDPQGVVAATVEGAAFRPAEVTDPRDRDRDQPVQELPHPGAPQGHGDADRHPLAQLEVGDRLAGRAHVRVLAGDRRQLLGRRLEDRCRPGLRLADAHVERDLLQPRRPPSGSNSRTSWSAGHDLALVELAEPRRRRCLLRVCVCRCFHFFGLLDRLAGALRVPHAAAAVDRPHADPGRLVVGGVEKHDVGDVDRPLLLDDASLAAPLGVRDGTRALVALDDVQRPRRRPARGPARPGSRLPCLALLLAGDDHDAVVGDGCASLRHL